MLHCEMLITDTTGGQQRWPPAIPQTQSIPKCSLCKTKPCSDNGSAVNQLEEPISLDKQTDLCRDDEREFKAAKIHKGQQCPGDDH